MKMMNVLALLLLQIYILKRHTPTLFAYNSNLESSSIDNECELAYIYGYSRVKLATLFTYWPKKLLVAEQHVVHLSVQTQCHRYVSVVELLKLSSSVQVNECIANNGGYA